MANFATIKDYLLQLNLHTDVVDESEELLIVNDEDSGLANLVIDCEDPILVIEQHIFNFVTSPESGDLSMLLKLNRELVHGAYCLNDDGLRVTFRDTLQMGNLDLNELEASIDALRLAMAEHAPILLKMAERSTS